MANNGMADFEFFTGPAMPRRDFVSRVYSRIVDQFRVHGTEVADIGALDASEVIKLKRQGYATERNDVLVYIANDCGLTLSRICDELMARGIIVLPVYVGRAASMSQLSHLAETQFTGEIAAEFGKSNVEFRQGNAGLILSGYNAQVSVGGTAATGRHNAIVMFARLLAQCPYSCVSVCKMREAYSRTIEFDAPNRP